MTTRLIEKLRGAIDPDVNEPLDRLLEDAANEIERLSMKCDLQEKAIEEGIADYTVLGERYYEGREEIEALQERLANHARALKNANDTMYEALKTIYFMSSEGEVRKLAWDSAVTADVEAEIDTQKGRRTPTVFHEEQQP